MTLTSPHDDGVAQGVVRPDGPASGRSIQTFRFASFRLRIQVFTPVEQRLARDDARERSLAIQEEAIAVWMGELERRFSPDLRALPIYNVPLRTRPA